MRKFGIYIFIFVHCIFFIQLVLADTNYKKVDVIKVLDGDTVKIQLGKEDLKVRLVGIDCFETAKISRAYKQAYENNISIDEVVRRGKSSKDLLEAFLLNHNDVHFDFAGIDKYGRALGYLYSGSTNINEFMQAEGGCPAYIYKKN